MRDSTPLPEAWRWLLQRQLTEYLHYPDLGRQARLSFLLVSHHYLLHADPCPFSR